GLVGSAGTPIGLNLAEILRPKRADRISRLVVSSSCARAQSGADRKATSARTLHPNPAREAPGLPRKHSGRLHRGAATVQWTCGFLIRASGAGRREQHSITPAAVGKRLALRLGRAIVVPLRPAGAGGA